MTAGKDSFSGKMTKIIYKYDTVFILPFYDKMYFHLISSRRNERESQDSLRRDEKNNHGRNRIDRGIVIFFSNSYVRINLLSLKD